jgi:hypothetical protein
VALKSDADAERSINQLSRDFPGRSIFDFCNKIGPIADSKLLNVRSLATGVVGLDLAEAALGIHSVGK